MLAGLEYREIPGVRKELNKLLAVCTNTTPPRGKIKRKIKQFEQRNWSNTPSALISWRTNKIGEPRLGGAGEFTGLTAPDEPDGNGVEGVVFKDEPGALLRRQALLDEGEV